MQGFVEIIIKAKDGNTKKCLLSVSKIYELNPIDDTACDLVLNQAYNKNGKYMGESGYTLAESYDVVKYKILESVIR